MINKLIAKIQKTKAPIVVGLDPMLSYIPEHIQKKAFEEYGETLEGAAEAIWQFNKEIVDKTYDLIPAVKPQIAMYEQFGIEGLKAYKKTIDYCKSKDLVVIGDIKRGDIGSTSAAYAAGHLGKVQVGSKCYVPFDEDFATVNPYLGSDGVKPFICLLYTSYREALAACAAGLAERLQISGLSSWKGLAEASALAGASLHNEQGLLASGGRFWLNFMKIRIWRKRCSCLA